MSTESKLKEFNDHGYIRLGRLISGRLLLEAQGQIERIMRGRVRGTHLSYQLCYDEDYERSGTQETPEHKGDTLRYRKISGLEHDPLFGYIAVHPFLKNIILPLFDSDVSIFRAVFINKPVGSQEYLPWHQDVPSAQRWDIGAGKAVFVWTAINDATKESGCLQVIPGSHKRGAWHDDHFATDADIRDNEFDKRKVPLEMSAGESVLINNFLMHKSDVNTSDQHRGAFSVCYGDALARNILTNKTYPVAFRRR